MFHGFGGFGRDAYQNANAAAMHNASVTPAAPAAILRRAAFICVCATIAPLAGHR